MYVIIRLCTNIVCIILYARNMCPQKWCAQKVPPQKHESWDLRIWCSESVTLFSSSQHLTWCSASHRTFCS